MLGSGINTDLEPQYSSYKNKATSPWSASFVWEKFLSKNSIEKIGTNSIPAAGKDHAEFISFRNSRLTDQDVMKIAEGLETNTHITALDLSQNYIEKVETIERLIQALKKNTTLQKIYVEENWVTRDRIGDQYANFEIVNCCVVMEPEEDYLARTAAVAKLYRVLEKRRNGDLKWSDEEVVEKEVEETSSSDSDEVEYPVEFLDFLAPEDEYGPKYPANPEYPWDSDFQFDATAYYSDIPSIKTNAMKRGQPKTVDMGTQKLNDEDIINLAEALETNTHITDIDLCNNNIRNVESIKRLTEAVEKNKTLQNICVEINWVTRDYNLKGDRDEEGNIVTETLEEFLDRIEAVTNLYAALAKNRKDRETEFEESEEEYTYTGLYGNGTANESPYMTMNSRGIQIPATKVQQVLSKEMNRSMAAVDEMLPHLAVQPSALDFSGFDLMSTKKQEYPKGSDTYWKVDVNFVVNVLGAVTKPNTRVNLNDIIVDSKGADLIVNAIRDNSNIGYTEFSIIVPAASTPTSTVKKTPMPPARKMSEIKWDLDFSDPGIFDVVGVQGVIDGIKAVDKANTSINLSNITVSMNDARRIAIALRDNTNITTINIANENLLILNSMELSLNTIFKSLENPVAREIYFRKDYAPIALLNEGFKIPKEAKPAFDMAGAGAGAGARPEPERKPKSGLKEEAPNILPKLIVTAITALAGAFITWQYSNPIKAISILGSGIIAWNGYDHNVGKLAVAASTILGTLKSHKDGNTSAELTCLLTLTANAAAWVYTIAPSKGDGPTLP